jgi:N6-adenosine-specific RNA methylase IME4
MLTESVSQLRLHPAAQLVPAMRPPEYAELLADIRAHGVKVPLDIAGRVVLDGRHRLQAAQELGLTTVPVRPVTVAGESARDWLVKAAVLRRHLTDDQRAMMAALIAQQHPQRKAGPGRGKRTTPTGGRALTKAQQHPSRTAAAGTMNVAPKRAEKAATVLNANPELAAQVHRGDVKLAQALRQVTRTAQLARVAHLPPTEGVYDVLVVDPPWDYDRHPADSGLRGEVPYLTESFEQLKRRTLPAAPDAVLWLWTTNAFMAEAHALATAWGFTPKTILTWDKVHIGLGSWLRNVREHCLCCVRGRPVVTLTNQTTLLREPRREHSRKPEAFYTLVEGLCPGRKWELFARTRREGWVSEGLESDKFPAWRFEQSRAIEAKWEPVLDRALRDHYAHLERVSLADEFRGYDRYVVDDSGQRVGLEYKVDEKWRQTGKIFVEVVSNSTTGRLGWLHTCSARWLLYFLTPHTVLVFFMTHLRAVGKEWERRYPIRPAVNDGYHTLGICVPLRVAAAGAESVSHLDRGDGIVLQVRGWGD